MMNTAPLLLRGLTTGYRHGRKQTLIASGLNGALPSATLTALVGSNGVGKTTLLRTLAGLQPSLRGEVMVDGAALSDYGPGGLSRRLSIVLTHRVDVSHLSVSQVVESGRMPYTGITGRLSSHDCERVDEALRLTHTAAFRDRTVDSLSDGERQRVMIAKALAQDTPIILLDEPTAFLDFGAKAELMRLLSTLVHDHGKTILLSTHDLELAFQMADRLWLLRRDGLTEDRTATLVADGRLHRFFAAEGLDFDAATCRFRLN